MDCANRYADQEQHDDDNDEKEVDCPVSFHQYFLLYGVEPSCWFSIQSEHAS